MKRRLCTVFLTFSAMLCSLIFLSISANAAEALEITAEVSSVTVNAGENVHISAQASGGTEGYKYRFISRDKSGKMTVIKNYGTDDYADITFEHGGTYQITAIVKDAKSVCKKQVMSVTVENPLVFDAALSSSSIRTGETVTLTAEASGGEKDYRYRFFYRDENNKMTVIQSYNSNNVKELTFEESGEYTITAVVMDNLGECKKEVMQLRVWKVSAEPVSVTSTISATTLLVGETLHLTAQGHDGTEPYIYKFSYKNAANEWIVVQNYSEKQEADMTFDEIGPYVIIVGCADGNYKYTENLYRITVRKDTGLPLVNTSSVSSTAAFEGNTVSLRASAEGGYLPYTYKFCYQNSDGAWTTLKDYGYSRTYPFKLSSRGAYNFRIYVSDGVNSSYKSFTVTAASRTTSYTISSARLMANPRWATVTLNSNVPYGSGVNIIQYSDNWIMVNYNGTVGWLYDLALGNYYNYSEVNTDTLPYVADDIIFNQGKDIRQLFNYVNRMGYRTMSKDSLENMCVYMIKYRRGACFQRAALLYYLLNRSGFTAYRVDDGIDAYTGGGPHNWCIVKTSSGWRHIDPTPVIGLKTFYLVQDWEVAPYFIWDREKYPACV